MFIEIAQPDIYITDSLYCQIFIRISDFWLKNIEKNFFFWIKLLKFVDSEILNSNSSCNFQDFNGLLEVYSRHLRTCCFDH